MQQFVVPQFIDVENKIIGPITTRQFVIFLVGALFIGVSYKLFDFSLFVTVGIIILGICGIFAFGKVNGRPFHYFILNLIQTSKRPNLRVWNREFLQEVNIEKQIATPKEEIIPEKEYFQQSRLAELSLIVDTQGMYKGGDIEQSIELKDF